MLLLLRRASERTGRGSRRSSVLQSERRGSGARSLRAEGRLEALRRTERGRRHLQGRRMTTAAAAARRRRGRTTAESEATGAGGRGSSRRAERVGRTRTAAEGIRCDRGRSCGSGRGRCGTTKSESTARRGSGCWRAGWESKSTDRRCRRCRRRCRGTAERKSATAAGGAASRRRRGGQRGGAEDETR